MEEVQKHTPKEEEKKKKHELNIRFSKTRAKANTKINASYLCRWARKQTAEEAEAEEKKIVYAATSQGRFWMGLNILCDVFIKFHFCPRLMDRSILRLVWIAHHKCLNFHSTMYSFFLHSFYLLFSVANVIFILSH